MTIEKTERICNRFRGSKRCLKKREKDMCPLGECKRILIVTKKERKERPSLKHNTLSGVFEKRRIA